MTDDRGPASPAKDVEEQDPTWLLDLEDDLRRSQTHAGGEPVERPSLLTRLLGRG